MSHDETITHIETMLTKLEKLGRLLVWALGLIISGAVWASTMQMRIASVESWKDKTDPKVEEHSSKLASIEGRLHGIASQVGKVPSRVAAKISEEVDR